MHEILEKVLIKWMKTISSIIKNDQFSKYDMKPDRPSNNAEKSRKPSNKVKKPDTDKKSDTDKAKKPDTDKDIKPNTDKDIKPGMHVNKKKSNTEKASEKGTRKGTKKDVRLSIKLDIVKHDIVRLDDKPKVNELQKTLINNKPHLKKMIDDIKRIFECVICEEFINGKFVPKYMFSDEFELISKYREDANESYSITASRKNIIIQRCDMPACDVTKYKMYTIHIEHDRVTLEA